MPSPEADKRTLIRRVTLDLTGLPPTPAEVNEFLANERPEAYERVIARLLDSPRFGERLSIEWLDAAGPNLQQQASDRVQRYLEVNGACDTIAPQPSGRPSDEIH